MDTSRFASPRCSGVGTHTRRTLFGSDDVEKLSEYVADRRHALIATCVTCGHSRALRLNVLLRVFGQEAPQRFEISPHVRVAAPDRAPRHSAVAVGFTTGRHARLVSRASSPAARERD
jgi:hypothetical protein